MNIATIRTTTTIYIINGDYNEVRLRTDFAKCSDYFYCSFSLPHAANEWIVEFMIMNVVNID